jgi:hypothetical protein
MSTKKLFQILLPLYDNKGVLFPQDFYRHVSLELTERFGGLTAYSRSPATGFWKDSQDELNVDQIIVYEVIAEKMDKKYWKSLKEILKAQFKQEDIIIRVMETDLV